MDEKPYQTQIINQRAEYLDTSFSSCKLKDVFIHVQTLVNKPRET